MHTHAGYTIEVPPNWNGKLTMWVPGFAGQGKLVKRPKQVFIAGASMGGHIIGRSLTRYRPNAPAAESADPGDTERAGAELARHR